MGKMDVVYRFVRDYSSLNLSPVLIDKKKMLKKFVRKVFINAYILKSKKQHINFDNLTINFFNFKDLFFLSRDIFTRLDYAFITDIKKPLIIDCGTNIGVSVLFFKWLFPMAEIHAFEPDKETFKLLEKNVKNNNFDNISIHNAAVSDFNGTIDFFVDNENPGSLVMSTIYERQPKDKIEVKSLKLSDYILNNFKDRTIDLLKIDIEGAEHKVFDDLFTTNSISKINSIILEYHHNIPETAPNLGKLLKSFELLGYNYQLSADIDNIYLKNQYQDFMIYFYKK